MYKRELFENDYPARNFLCIVFADQMITICGFEPLVDIFLDQTNHLVRK